MSTVSLRPLCEQHKFFILTKRPERLLSHYRGAWTDNAWLGVSVWDQESANRMIPLLLQTPAAHRWVSYEPALGPVDFSWCLPLRCCNGQDCACQGMPINPPPYLDFIVAGGEAGPGARPAHPDWFRRVRDDCKAAGVPFHLKHLGKWYPRSEKSDGENVGFGQFGVLSRDGNWMLNTTGWNGRDIDPDTGEAYLISTPGRTAGRLLDGQLHDEVPE